MNCWHPYILNIIFYQKIPNNEECLNSDNYLPEKSTRNSTKLFVSKILIAINKGKGAHYKGKTLKEIEFLDSIGSDDSDEERNNQGSNLLLTNLNDKPGPSKSKIKESSVTEYLYEEMKVGVENDSSCMKGSIINNFLNEF